MVLVQNEHASVYGFLGPEHVPAYNSLLTTQSREASRIFLEKLPASISTLWGYELRLENTDLHSDFQICISKASYGAFQEFLSQSPFTHPLWSRFRELSTRWTIGADPVYHLLRNIWLEMDAAEMQSDNPMPNFFFAPVDGLDTAEFTKVVRHMFSILGFDLTNEEIASVSGIHALLPAGSWIPQIGMMAARPGKQAVRLFVHNIREHEIMPFVKGLGYNFDCHQLEALLSEMARIFDFVDINVEADHPERQDVVGLEGYFYSWDIHKLEKMITYLRGKGLLDERYISKLRDYLVASERTSDSLYREFIHHVKISYAGYAHLHAKLYVGVKRSYNW